VDDPVFSVSRLTPDYEWSATPRDPITENCRQLPEFSEGHVWKSLEKELRQFRFGDFEPPTLGKIPGKGCQNYTGILSAAD